MGKASRWLRSFLSGRKDKEKERVASPFPTLSVEKPSATMPSPVHKEKKRWSFRRSGGPGAGRDPIVTEPTHSVPIHQASVADRDQKQPAITLAAATNAAMAAAETPEVVIQLSTASECRSDRSASAIEESAAIKIQSCFRSYLARKALRALKGLVKLQALVRGHLVRKQATATLRCMQALVTVQARARAQRIRMVEGANTTPQRKASHRRSLAPQDPRYRRSYEMERNIEEEVKIVEVDFVDAKGSSRSQHYHSSKQDERTDARLSSCYGGSRTSKPDYCQQVSSAPSAITDMSPRACSSYFEEFSLNTLQSSPYCHSAISQPYVARECFSSQQDDTYSVSNDHYCYPNYMANTESSRAKARSQSAPKQRPDMYERQPSRRRPLVEGRNIPKYKMQRSSSQVGSSQHNRHYYYPCSIKLDRSNMSFKDSECGSTSTILTNTNYCRSVASYDIRS